MALTFMTAQGDVSSTGMPSDVSFQYGSSDLVGPALAFGGPRILLNKQNFPAASPVNPGATGADNVLAVYSLPANTLDAGGRTISVRAMGSLAGNTNSKTLKIIFNPSTAVVGSTVGSGGTTIAATNAFATGSGVAWAIEGMVIKDSSTANRQTSLNPINAIGAGTSNLTAPTAITANESAAILIAVTGNAATTATDIGLILMEVTARC